MSRIDRVKLITEIENIRNSRVICYITGDRPGLETRIGMDVFPLFYDLLNKVGFVEQLDLFLYSSGGIIMSGWGLVNVLREFCNKLAVLVPFKAHSTATLIALGADEIIMGKLGQLSPVDPSVQSPFNPQIQDKFLPVSVEDVAGFFDLAHKEAKLNNEESMITVLDKLASDVRPMALGNVYRAREQIRMLTHRLLNFHMKDEDEKVKDSIVTILTKELYSHDYLISRKEAGEIGLNVIAPLDKLEKVMWSLFMQYANDIDLFTPYSQETLLGQDNEKTFLFQRAFVETREGGYVYSTTKQVKRISISQPSMPPVEGFQERVLEDGWKMLN